MAEKVKIRWLLPGNLSLRTEISEKLVTKFANTQRVRRFAEIQARAAELLENSKIRRALAEKRIPDELIDKEAIAAKRLIQGFGTYTLAGGLAAQLAVLQALTVLGGEYHATAAQAELISRISATSHFATFAGIFSLSLGTITSKTTEEFNAIKLSTRLLKPKSEELISANERKLLAAIPNLQKNSHNLILLADAIEAERTRLRELKLERKKSKKQREISPKPRRKS